MLEGYSGRCKPRAHQRQAAQQVLSRGNKVGVGSAHRGAGHENTTTAIYCLVLIQNGPFLFRHVFHSCLWTTCIASLLQSNFFDVHSLEVFFHVFKIGCLALCKLCFDFVLQFLYQLHQFCLVFWVEGQPWVPDGSTVGPRSLLRALGNQTKLSAFDTVAFRVRRRPDRFHALRRAPPLYSPCQKFGNTDYFLKIPAKAKIRCSMKHGRQPSNQLRGAQDAASHACSTGLSTGHHLMPMKALCGAASQCRGATTVSQLSGT